MIHTYIYIYTHTKWLAHSWHSMSVCNYFLLWWVLYRKYSRDRGTPEKRNLTQSWRSRGSQAGLLEVIRPSQHVLQEERYRAWTGYVCVRTAGGSQSQLLLWGPRNWVLNTGVKVNEAESSPLYMPRLSLETLQSGTVTSLSLPSKCRAHPDDSQGLFVPLLKGL